MIKDDKGSEEAAPDTSADIGNTAGVTIVMCHIHTCHCTGLSLQNINDVHWIMFLLRCGCWLTTYNQKSILEDAVNINMALIAIMSEFKNIFMLFVMPWYMKHGSSYLYGLYLVNIISASDTNTRYLTDQTPNINL